MPFPVDRKWIAETENKLGVRFPDSFVIAMSTMNGGMIEVGGDVFWLNAFLDGTDRKRIARTASSIDRETVAMRRWDHFQSDLVVIGHNGGGDLLVLASDPSDPERLQSAVFWWDHETSEIEEVAEDFGDLKKT